MECENRQQTNQKIQKVICNTKNNLTMNKAFIKFFKDEFHNVVKVPPIAM